MLSTFLDFVTLKKNNRHMKKLFSTAIMLLSFTVMDVSANQCPKALDFEIKRLGEDKVENLCQYKGKVCLLYTSPSPRDS